MERLARLGIPPALYEDFVTSGEVARSFLAAAPAELRAAGSLGPLHCLPLGSPAGSALMAGLDIIEATIVGEADLLLVASFGQPPPPRHALDAVLDGKSVGEGTRATVRVDPGGRASMNKKQNTT